MFQMFINVDIFISAPTFHNLLCAVRTRLLSVYSQSFPPTSFHCILCRQSCGRTVAKISILGSDYQSALLQTIPEQFVPSQLGGPLLLENEDFDFDTSPGGPLYTPPSATYTP